MMKNEEENSEDEYPDDNEEKEPGETEGNEMFVCPSCKSNVANEATECPGCGAVFEQKGEIPLTSDEGEKESIPLPYGVKEEHMAPPYETEEEQVPLPYGVDEEQMDLSSEAEEEDMPLTSDYGEEQMTSVDTEEETESEKGLKTEQKVTGAVTDYDEQRRKRYLFGTLSLSMGLVLFVLLWLVVVYEVLVTETENWFGAIEIFILAGAGIFFMLGLYMILTYPKSKLAELLASMSMKVQTGDPGIESGGNFQKPMEYHNH